MTRNTDYQIDVTVVTGGSSDFEFTIDSFMNPFSQLSSTSDVNRFEIVHYTSCDKTETATACCAKESSSAACETSCFVHAPQFSGPSAAELGDITTVIAAADGSSNNIIGSEDGTFAFTLNSGPYWPVYGGKLILTLPTWYGDGSPLVFDDDTMCTSPDLVIDANAGFKLTPSASTSTAIIIKYTEQTSITLTCTLYKNPVYRKIVSGFKVTITDNEDNPTGNSILETQVFELDATSGLTAITMDTGSVDFNFWIGADIQTLPV
jgi:hypothetical protein